MSTRSATIIRQTTYWGAEATRDYCGAMVQWHIDHIRDMEEDA